MTVFAPDPDDSPKEEGGVLGISSEAFAAYHQQVLHLIPRLRDAPDSPGAA